MKEGVYYGQFNSDDDYFMLKNYSKVNFKCIILITYFFQLFYSNIKKDMDALIWSNDQKRLMIVKESSHDLIKKFYKQNKPK